MHRLSLVATFMLNPPITVACSGYNTWRARRRDPHQKKIYWKNRDVEQFFTCLLYLVSFHHFHLFCKLLSIAVKSKTKKQNNIEKPITSTSPDT